MIKAKQYHNENLGKIEFDAKTGWWVFQDRSIHMTLSMEIITIGLTPNELINLFN